jgi:hypothetical protein
MPDDPTNKPGEPRVNDAAAAMPEPPAAADLPNERADRGISDFVRRALSVGVGAAARSKDDIMRVAAAEMRTWLEHLNLNEEIARTLSTMVIEIKTEIRFRPSDAGNLVPQASNDVKVKGSEP